MFEKLTSWTNLLAAYGKAARGKRGRGPVSAFEHRLEENLLELQEELLTGSYRPGGYHSFLIREPKRRLISAAPFRDRVVHHALTNVLEPPFERSFVADSFANRRGMGTHRALNRCQKLARRHRYVLAMDVRQFFPSIDHEILRKRLERKVRDGRVLGLVDRILESGRAVLAEEYTMVSFPGDDLFAVLRPRGLPIGNLTSQFWGNVYLDPLDHFVKRELGCRGYVRYVDDLLLFGDEKTTLWRWKEVLSDRLARLRLTAHAGAHPRPVSEGISFLGFLVTPDRRRLKRRKGLQYRRRFELLLARHGAGTVSCEKLESSFRGWTNHARTGNTVGLRRSFLERLRARSAGCECVGRLAI